MEVTVVGVVVLIEIVDNKHRLVVDENVGKAEVIDVDGEMKVKEENVKDEVGLVKAPHLCTKLFENETADPRWYEWK